jgi:hypothetical protein
MFVVLVVEFYRAKKINTIILSVSRGRIKKGKVKIWNRMEMISKNRSR